MAATNERANVLDAVRAFGVMLGGSVVLNRCRSGEHRGNAHRASAWPSADPVALAGTGASIAYALVVHPWLMSWGTRAVERVEDCLATNTWPRPACRRRAPSRSTRRSRRSGLACPDRPGQSRLLQLRVAREPGRLSDGNADRIRPEWQERTVGETVKLHWANGLELTRFEPNRVFALGGWYVALKEEQWAHAANRPEPFPAGRASLAYGILLELPHFIMERKMLLGIKERAERAREEAKAGMTETSELALYPLQLRPRRHALKLAGRSYSYYPLGDQPLPALHARPRGRLLGPP